MKFALLGYSRAAMSLAHGAIASGHQFVAAFDATPWRDEIRAVAPMVRFRDDWEGLLAERAVDAVLVAGPWLPESMPSDARERRDDQLRKLIQAEVPLLVIPPVCEAIVGFELEMIRKDASGIIVPVMPLPLHAAWDDLADWLSPKAASVLGPVEIVLFERFLPVRQRIDVLSTFVQDIEVLRRMAGPLKRITASGGGPVEGNEKPTLGSLSVQAQGEASFPVRWTVHPAGDFSGARATVFGDNDRATLVIPANGEPWELQAPGIEQSYPPQDDAAVVLDELELAIARKHLRGVTPAVTWADACRAVEAMEAIDRSIVRGRAVDLFNEEHSEESSFKGIMAAGGCLMLLGTLGLFLLAGIFAAVFRPGRDGWPWFQWCLIVPLGLFLIAQLLAFGLAAHHRRKSQATGDSGPAKIAD